MEEINQLENIEANIERLTQSAAEIEERLTAENERIEQSKKPGQDDFNRSADQQIRKNENSINNAKLSIENEKKRLARVIVEMREKAAQEKKDKFVEYNKKNKEFNSGIKRAKNLKLRMKVYEEDGSEHGKSEYKLAKGEHVAQMEKMKELSKERTQLFKEYTDMDSKLNQINEKSNELIIKYDLNIELSKEPVKQQKEQKEQRRQEEQPKKRPHESFVPWDGKPGQRDWHQDLTQEQIDELIAEGLNPGDQEYDQYLMQHGIDPKTARIIKAQTTDILKDTRTIDEINWHPDLTQEQIDELWAEGLRPGDQEYDQYLMQHGIDPNRIRETRQRTGRRNIRHEDIHDERDDDDGGRDDDDGGRDDDDGGRDDDDGGRDDDDEIHQDIHPIRSFWEIESDTNTEHSGSIAIALKRLGDIKLLKTTTPLNALFLPIRALSKGVGKIGDVISGASRKEAQMYENIENLSPEEFEVLVSGMTEQKMRQNKFNDLYLSAISKRLTNRQNDRVQEAIEQVDDAEREIQACASVREQQRAILDDLRSSEEEKAQARNALAAIDLIESGAVMQKSMARERQEREMKIITDFDRGRMNKTTMRMNIKGWFAGVFNPDNRDIDAQMAELSKRQREAREVGDFTTVAEMEKQMEEVEKANTKEIKFFGSDKCVISRGGRIHEPVVVRPNDVNQTKAAQLAANIAMIANITALVQEAQRAQQVQAEQTRINHDIETHNTDIGKVNTQNSQLNSQINEVKSATTPDQTWVDAANKQIGQDQALHTGIGHNTEFINDNNGVGFNVNGSDEALHAADQAMQASTDQVRSGLTGNAAQDFSTLVGHHQSVTGPAVVDVAKAGLDTAKVWDATTAFHEGGFVSGLNDILSGNTDALTILQQIASKGSALGQASMAPTMGNVVLNIPSHLVPNIIATAANAKALSDIQILEAKQRSFNHQPEIREEDPIKKDGKKKDDDMEID